MDRQEVCSFQKNQREIVRSSLDTYRDRFLADLRVFYEDPADGEYKATRKGITIGVERLPDLARAVTELMGAAGVIAGTNQERSTC